MQFFTPAQNKEEALDSFEFFANDAALENERKHSESFLAAVASKNLNRAMMFSHSAQEKENTFSNVVSLKFGR